MKCQNPIHRLLATSRPLAKAQHILPFAKAHPHPPLTRSWRSPQRGAGGICHILSKPLNPPHSPFFKGGGVMPKRSTPAYSHLTPIWQRHNTYFLSQKRILPPPLTRSWRSPQRGAGGICRPSIQPRQIPLIPPFSKGEAQSSKKGRLTHRDCHVLTNNRLPCRNPIQFACLPD